MPKIRRLSDEVISLIAAGEVIERPASALKELLENSLDAGSRRIDCEWRGAGKKLLRVTDDGSGMDKEDLSLAFERHATSKIETGRDLEHLETYGFRGEALYSIASISKLSLSSAVLRAKSGWTIEATAGRAGKPSPAPPVKGTTIEVCDLFFNTPARLKFLKSDSFERARLASVLEEAALSSPEVHFAGKSEGRGLWNWAAETATDPIESARRRLKAVLGAELADGLVPIEAERPGFKLLLFLSPADKLLASRRFQHWFINRRPVDSRLLQTALYRAYASCRGPEKHPAWVGFLEMAPESFDVNVHPAKREVRFKSERELSETVFALTESFLLKGRRAAAIFPSEGARQTLGTSVVQEPGPRYSFAPATHAQAELGMPLRPAEALSADEEAPLWWSPPYRFLGQIESSYLVFEAKGGLFLLDQHAAAERILFEKLLGQIEAGKVPSQRLAVPFLIELPSSKISDILDRRDELARLGFELAAFGDGKLRVSSAPALLADQSDLKESLYRLLDAAADLSSEEDALKAARHEALATVACKASVKAHDRLGAQEALQLLEDLRLCKDGSRCPHGRRAILAMDRDELARRFQRPGAPPL